MSGLNRAIAAGRDLHHNPEVTYSAYWFNEYQARMADLLAALDAARGQAVLYVSSAHLAEGRSSTTAVIPATSDAFRHIYDAPLYAAPPAAAVSAENADTLASIRDYLDRCGYKHWVAAFDSALKAPPDAMAVPATMADGWRHDICATLNRVMPSWIAAGKTPIEAACNAIEALASVACEAHAQQPAAAVPEGYALVPVEPTEAMVEAGARWGIHGDFDADLSNGTKETCRRHAAGSWAAMLAAADRSQGVES